jgi:hypothetical protein
MFVAPLIRLRHDRPIQNEDEVISFGSLPLNFTYKHSAVIRAPADYYSGLGKGLSNQLAITSLD